MLTVLRAGLTMWNIRQPPNCPPKVNNSHNANLVTLTIHADLQLPSITTLLSTMSFRLLVAEVVGGALGDPAVVAALRRRRLRD